MANKLTAADLEAIKNVMVPVIKETVAPMIKEAIEEVAIITNNAVQKEVNSLRSGMADMKTEMATKQNIADIRAEMATEFKKVRAEMVTKHDLFDAVVDLKDELSPVLENHEQRLKRLEVARP